MEYLALARKYRPTGFSSLVGQTHVVSALTHALNAQRLHHAYLFTGTRGVGKTTLARILAACFNCEEGVSATPCGKCTACREIQEGRFADLIEVDAATNTGVNEMRQLLESAIYAPTRGRFKVYVVDEVHMLSVSAFNAMLKTLEEPPAHLKFILATTDPQKIPVTVLSRCLQLNLKPLTVSMIEGQLSHIAETEGAGFEAGALNLLAKAARGSMRDALSLLDQAISHGAGQLNTADVRDMLGIVETDYLYRILDALAAHDVPRMLLEADTLEERGVSPETVLNELAQKITLLAILQLSPNHLAETEPDREKLLSLAQAISPEALQLYYQICIYGRRDLPWAPDPTAGLLMTLMRLGAFTPQTVSSLAFDTGSQCSRTAGNTASLAQTSSAVRTVSTVSHPAQPSVQTSAPEHVHGARTTEFRERMRQQRQSQQRDAKAQNVVKNQGESKSYSSQSDNLTQNAASAGASLPHSPALNVETKTEEASSSASVSSKAFKTTQLPVESTPEKFPAEVSQKAEPCQEKARESGLAENNALPNWHELIDQMALKGPARQLAINCALVGRTENILEFQAPKSYDTPAMKSTLKKLEQSVRDALNAPDINIKMTYGEVEEPTYAMVQHKAKEAARQTAINAIESDPQVRKFMEVFDATIDMNSIQPITKS